MDFLTLSATSAAVAAAIATIYYAKLTAAMVAEMQYGNDMLLRPNLNIILEPSKSIPQMLELSLINTGNAPAYKISIVNHTDQMPGLFHSKDKLAIFNTEIPVFSEGQSIRTMFLNYPDFYNNKPDNSILKFTITYTMKTRRGEVVKSNSIDYDLLIWANTSCHTESSLSDIVKQQQNFNDKLKDINRSLDKILTETIRGNLAAISFPQPMSLDAAINNFVCSWVDFKSLDREAYHGALRTRLNVLSYQLYSLLTLKGETIKEVSVLRQNLVRLSQKTFMIDGGISIREYSELGDEIVTSLMQLKLH
jgi:hypothetical protein